MEKICIILYTYLHQHFIIMYFVYEEMLKSSWHNLLLKITISMTKHSEFLLLGLKTLDKYCGLNLRLNVCKSMHAAWFLQIILLGLAKNFSVSLMLLTTRDYNGTNTHI